MYYNGHDESLQPTYPTAPPPVPPPEPTAYSPPSPSGRIDFHKVIVLGAVARVADITENAVGELIPYDYEGGSDLL